MSFKTGAEIAEQVRNRYDWELQQIRRDTSRTPEWKKAELAKVYLRMRDDRDRQVAERDRLQRDKQLTLEQQVFGTGSSKYASDHASLVISRRDAGDRAAKLQSEQQALELLSRANRSGDEPLARAIAERATEMRWAEVADAFLDGRPSLVDSMNELWNQTGSSVAHKFMEAMQMQVMPQELYGMSEYQIEQLAKSTDTAATS